MSWQRVVEKLDLLALPLVENGPRKEIVEIVAHLEAVGVADLTRLLARVGGRGDGR